MTGRLGRVIGAVFLLSVVALGCDAGTDHVTVPLTVTTTQPVRIAPQRGAVVAAAEGEPACMDWIESCANSPWGVYMVEANTLPRAYDVNAAGTNLPSILLNGEAKVSFSGEEQVVSYSINLRAVWSDHQPITSTDFKYSWQQVMTSPNVPDRSGYDEIVSVDDSDPHTAVVTFDKPYADWKALFGGRYGILPSHLLAGKDRDALMRDGYNFSGGPWVLDRWSKGRQVELSPNQSYWGKMPELKSLTFMIITDPTVEQDAFSAGTVMAAYPEPQISQAVLRDQPGVLLDISGGLAIEGIWFNVQKAPLASVLVRQALAYATDRDAIVREELAPLQPSIRTSQSFYPAASKVDSRAYARYRVNPVLVDRLMTQAGWTMGADRVWAKGPTVAAVEIKTTAGNPRRLATAELLQSQWRAAGFQVTIAAEPATTLLDQDLPAGNFQVALYASAPTDAGGCSMWCSASIPTLLNGLSGANFDRIGDATLDRDWAAAETGPSSDVRRQDALAGEQRLADLVPAIPLAALPDVVLVKTTDVAAEGGVFQRNPVYGPFLYANEWHLAGPAAGVP